MEVVRSKAVSVLFGVRVACRARCLRETRQSPGASIETSNFANSLVSFVSILFSSPSSVKGHYRQAGHAPNRLWETLMVDHTRKDHLNFAHASVFTGTEHTWRVLSVDWPGWSG